MKDLPIAVRSVIASFMEAVDRFLPTVEHVYIHGSLAMGGFHPKHSDVDLLLVVSEPLTREDRERLIDCCLSHSNAPYPLELSILSIEQLMHWRHPSPFEFHYSEGWRSRFEGTDCEVRVDLQKGLADPDLAAHVHVIVERGMIWRGRPIREMLHGYTAAHFADAIRMDALECLENIEENPMYSILNLTRVFAYERDRTILSKQEVRAWVLNEGHFPGNIVDVVDKATQGYEGEDVTFDQHELNEVRQYMNEQLQQN
ncbi:aminoglycoside adenylyltransferase domain-containing protein [Exiguobacterium qingdaonense]|uniref:aminoglycoside adenylyltransferase domain-containing protein n=1 Tax=Exiguobacterium qingdaonense TaxID=2751251 RepID=UPI001BEA6EA5|nr:aminoglycoside adenylyltransferase domain-containing protein [Exiguobacterium qingdaonense]